MSNPIYQAIGGKQNPMQNQFFQFMQQMQGKDPNKIINEIVSSGRITQAQLDQVQQQARQMEGAFQSMRGMFGL